MRQYTYSGIFLVLLVGSGLSINSGAGVLATVLFIVGMASGVLAIREDIKNKRAIAEETKRADRQLGNDLRIATFRALGELAYANEELQRKVDGLLIDACKHRESPPMVSGRLYYEADELAWKREGLRKVAHASALMDSYASAA